jgi:hypothetical protein
MRQLSLHYVRHYLHISMSMLTEHPSRLDEVIIHHSKDTKVGILIGVILCKTKVESALQPVTVIPSREGWFVLSVTKHCRVRLAYKETAGGDVQGLGTNCHGGCAVFYMYRIKVSETMW